MNNLFEQFMKERRVVMLRTHWFRKSNLKPGLETHQKMFIFRFAINMANPIDVKPINSIINEI